MKSLPPRVRNEIGNVYGRLTVTKYLEKRGDYHWWLCKCSCGNTKETPLHQVRYGRIKSCGCLVLEQAVAMKYKHGMSKSPEHNIWCAIIYRCTNENGKDYARYGGRGITICDEWRNSFQSFYSDMGSRPTPSHSIERINNNLGYLPSNCVWAAKSTQARNRGVPKNNKTGATGVTMRYGKYLSRITVNGSRIQLGIFATLDSAISARKAAEDLHWQQTSKYQ